MNAKQFLDELRANGRYSFLTDELEERLGITRAAALNTIHRLIHKDAIVSPSKGFYLIIPPEYKAYGCLPAEMFVPNMMEHWGQAYHVGFLSAAQYYGAAHQQPQRFQVVIPKNRRSIHCGRIHVEFIANKWTLKMPVKHFNTAAGTIAVATPEVIAMELVNAPRHGAGINNVATVLSELAEHIEGQSLNAIFLICEEVAFLQRLGYLFMSLGCKELSHEISIVLKGRRLHWTRLVAGAPYKALLRDQKWKIIVNTAVEPDT